VKFRDSNSEEEPQLNITPLIDVVFLLLIFFMVSTTFSKENQLRIKLPESSETSEQVQPPSFVEIQISADGQYAVQSSKEATAKPLVNNAEETLMRAIELAAKGNKDLDVAIRADRKTPHESVIRAMDAARRLGLTRITFVTQRAAPNEP